MVDVIEFGDCRDIMRNWIELGVKVHTCVTSPPYFGLRDYNCDGQIGLEKTPDEYIATLVDVFRHVRELLVDDGTLWVNIGDTYATNGGAHGGRSDNQRGVGAKRTHDNGGGDQQARRAPEGLKPKDLIGIPWMLAFALRADGWYLRQDIIWHKPNPMPESVRDRCTKAHEYVFLLSKGPRYFFDSDAIKEPSVRAGDIPGGKGHYIQHSAGGHNKDGLVACGQRPVAEKRNRRSVWTIATKPYKGAHFATFPEKLIEPCILAGAGLGDVVLDPFMGSGTTAAVAKRLGCHYMGCELNPENAPLIAARLA